MREEATLVPDPLARKEPGQLTDLPAAVPRHDHMVRPRRPLGDTPGRGVVLHVHGHRRSRGRGDFQVVGVLAWPELHLDAGQRGERVAETHLGYAWDHDEPPHRKAHALGTLKWLRRRRGGRHATVTPPKRWRSPAARRGWLDLVVRLMRPEAAVDVGAVDPHRPVAQRARPPAALLPTSAPPEYPIVWHSVES